MPTPTVSTCLARSLIILCLASPLAHAGNIDLSTATFYGAGSISAVGTANSLMIYGSTGAHFTSLSGVVSFDYSFTDTIRAQTSTAGFVAPALQFNQIELASNITLNGLPNTGWQTYTFQTPYDGTLDFVSTNAVANATFSYLEIRNLSTNVSPVPEPESYAMWMTGLGLMGCMARRRTRRTRRVA